MLFAGTGSSTQISSERDCSIVNESPQESGAMKVVDSLGCHGTTRVCEGGGVILAEKSTRLVGETGRVEETLLITITEVAREKLRAFLDYDNGGSG